MISQIDVAKKSVYKIAAEKNLFYRVLYVNQLSDKIYVLELRNNPKKPGNYVEMFYSDFTEDIRQGKLIKHPDIFIRNAVEEKISKKARELRDKAWVQIESLVKKEPNIYIPALRFEIIKEANEQEGGASITSYYKWLKSFDAWGQIKNALIPWLSNCGAPGVEKSNCELNDDTKAIIRKGYAEFFVGKATLRKAYKDTLRVYYNPKLHGEKEFTKDQFYYWGSMEWTYSEELQRKIGHRKFKSTRRLLKGRATDMASYVGELFMIDWTMMDIHVVSSLNRNDYIGRPTLYLVVDTVSRVITGVLLTFESPSHITLCNAFYNAGRNKVEFAKECGFDIGEDEWTTNIISNRLMGDRGELLSTKADSLVNNLHVTVENTRAYSPELKGIIENLIGRISDRVKQRFDAKGKVEKDFGERLSNDSRKEATVTLNELYEITIRCIIEYNNHHWIDTYPLTTEMVRDKVKPIPMEIWKWAKANGYMTGAEFEKRTLWLSLLENKMVTPSRKGIYLNKQDFVPVNADDFRLLENIICAPIVDEIKISYDPRVYHEIFWIHENNFIPLRTRGENDAKYSNEWEVIGTNESYKELSKEYKQKELLIEIENDKKFATIIGTEKKTEPTNLKKAKPGKKAEIALGRKAIPSFGSTQQKIQTNLFEQDSKYGRPDYSEELNQLDNL
ncbi:MAG TPA: hypothetical protein PKL56_11875 [Cyclobacteriaceae bacterium]|nr:hypothetical protein [Cyclobacteriaceae bacterium]HMV07492.1 hypothetical protein [Cyclobacteriaceae bacterium]HMW99153.1 hypothetical protein [Cyclobacteriaceae bacterium]HMX48214.1 hypothetical protein [Cyclobacteriaceae bacterium]HMY95019.1 hypothetical protein [Cyclobacteriaceae bacterium]